MEEGDSWRLRLKESNREYYEKLNESEKKFYGELNEIRLQMGMSPVKVPFFALEESTELKDCVPVVPVQLPFDAGGESDSTSYAPEILEIPSNLGDDTERQDCNALDSPTNEPNCYVGERSHMAGFQEVQASAGQLLQAFQQIRADFQEWREEGEGSTQEIVPSKVAQVDAHNLLEEMAMGDGSAKLQEMGDFEPLKVTSLPLLEEIDGASSKVVSASLTGFVVEPHFVLLYDDGLPIIENREYQYVCPDIDVEWEKIFDGIQSSMREVMTGSIIPIKVRVSDRWASSMEFLVNINAHKVFVEKSRPSVHQLEPSEINLDEESQSVIDMVVDKHRLWNGNLIFDPGIAYLSSAIGSLSVLVLGSIREETSIDVLLSKDRRNWVFDPGGRRLLLSSDIGRQPQHLSLLHQLSAC